MLLWIFCWIWLKLSISEYVVMMMMRMLMIRLSGMLKIGWLNRLKVLVFMLVYMRIRFSSEKIR